MRDDLPGLLAQILDGWPERVEYAVVIEGNKEYRAEQRFQRALLVQLAEVGYLVPQNGDKSGGGGAVNKPESKVPGNLVRPDEILCSMLEVVTIHLEAWGTKPFAVRRSQRLSAGLLKIREEAVFRSDMELDDLEHDLLKLVKRARILLGYDFDTQTFADTVCGQCGGKLLVARELPVEVRCGDCGHRYPWQSWLRMFEDGDGQTLVDTEVACLHAGVPRGTLYRWASEGRITRYGSRGKGMALWDLMELGTHGCTELPGQLGAESA